jgi:hypothetical protein
VSFGKWKPIFLDLSFTHTSTCGVEKPTELPTIVLHELLPHFKLIIRSIERCFKQKLLCPNKICILPCTILVTASRCSTFNCLPPNTTFHRLPWTCFGEYTSERTDATFLLRAHVTHWLSEKHTWNRISPHTHGLIWVTPGRSTATLSNDDETQHR